ncbi:MAG: macro domain-containing protein [Saccharofermentans sp.]|nr:macro domain-containing protein [Saccharofermentans sp.]
MAFKIVRNDITLIEADAIVNTANPGPLYMAGTDSAVYEAAGAEKLLEERQKIGPIKEGQTAVTPAFGLPAKYIIHTVGPVWDGGDKGEKEILKNCYLNCLNKAVELGIESIAFPLISTGVNGFPKAEALLTATSVFSSFLSEHDMDITLVVFDNESFTLSGRIFAGVDQFIDENYVEEKAVEEYPDEEVPFELPNFCLPPEDAAKEPRLSRRERRRARPKFLRAEESRSAPPDMDACMGGAMGGAAMASAAHMAAAAPVGAAPVPVKRSLEDVVKQVSETWSESLLRMITEKGYTDIEVYKRANVDRKLFSKIRSNKDYKPKKPTALAFALALKLNVDETKDFLGRAGYALSKSSVSDLIVEYFIDNGVYDIMTINLALYEHNEPLLG